MSVNFANGVISRLRFYGVKVHEAPGWQTRGNGQSSNYQGGIMHHTATGFAIAVPGNSVYNLLVNGRSDLRGPLCNSAGNSDGSITVIAANPANHAGASGGYGTSPLPVTSSFNRTAWGHEIVYPGNSPMTPAQYDSMVILGIVLTELLERPNANWIKGHGETSITGKWDPGYAPGKMISMSQVRDDINRRNVGGDFLSALSDEQQRFIYNRIAGIMPQRYFAVDKETGKIKEVPSGTPGAKPATLLDSLDGNYIVNEVTDVAARVARLENIVNNLPKPEVNVSELASAIAQQLNVEIGVGVPAEQMQAAVEAALIKVNRERWGA